MGNFFDIDTLANGINDSTGSAVLAVVPAAHCQPLSAPYHGLLPSPVASLQVCVSDAAIASDTVVMVVAGAAGTQYGSFGLCVAPGDALLPAVRRRAAALGLHLPAPYWLSLAGKPIGDGVSVRQLGVAPPRSGSGVLALQLHGQRLAGGGNQTSQMRQAGGAACIWCPSAFKAAHRGHKDCLTAHLYAAGTDIHARDEVCG